MDEIFIDIELERKIYRYFCKGNDLLFFVSEKFKRDSGQLYSNFFFLYNANKLDLNKTLIQNGLINGAHIRVVLVGQLPGGGLSLNFTDLSKNIYEEHYLSKASSGYRIVSKGINVYGICKGKKCKAYNKEVICPLIGKIIFNLLEEKDDLECPICGGLIVPKTLGFFCCEYRIKGKKLENEYNRPFELIDKASNKDSIRYFNPDKNGKAMITELIVEVIKFL